MSQLTSFYAVNSLNYSSHSYFSGCFFHLYTIVEWSTHHSNIELQFSNSEGLFFTYTAVLCTFTCFYVTDQCFHFSFKNSFQPFLQGRSSGGELPQLLFFWENLYFSFMSEK